jgi:hypothetical protein
MYGVSIAELMYWRGDTSPESSISYINNKSDLERQYNEVVEKYSIFLYGKQKS